MKRLFASALAAVAATAVVGTSGAVAHSLTAHDAAAVRTDARAAHSFGPTGYHGVRLGMSPRQVRHAGGRSGNPRPMECAGVKYPHSTASHGSVDGYVSKKHGVVFLAAPTRRATTPQGIHVGSTKARARAAYPHLRRSVDYWSTPVPGHPRLSYWLMFGHGKVTDLALVANNQDCVN